MKPLAAPPAGRAGFSLARFRAPALILAGAALSIGAYLGLSLRTYRLGFPLDDAWIHATYARNLTEAGGWAFQPGHLSAGSTAPLWTFLLAVGRWLGGGPLLWAYALGCVGLAAIAWECVAWLRERAPGLGGSAWVAAPLILIEWHLTWAAASGMETIAQALLIVAVLRRLDRAAPSPFWIGLLVGVGIWIRPDALTLALPLGLTFAWRARQGLRRLIFTGAQATAGLAVVSIPYLAFNLALGGSPWPSTLYAKQAEYAVLRDAPLLHRALGQFELPLVGLGAILLPGLAIAILRAARQGEWNRLIPLAWFVAFLGAYALRLPVTYQHGRYVIPSIPVLIVLGLEGTLGWVRLDAEQAARRVLSRTWLLAAVAIGVVFWVLGARAYANDVAIIETEMVDTARWIAANTEPGALIAAHDIGALGYFGGRPLVDLAGLASPEVISFLRDEAALAAYLDERHASYLMTFPGWYPELTAGLEPLYRSTARFSPAAGGENMVVYRWAPSDRAGR